MKCETAVCPYANVFNMITKIFDELNTAVMNLAKRSLSVNEYEDFCKEIKEAHDRLTEENFKHEP